MSLNITRFMGMLGLAGIDELFFWKRNTERPNMEPIDLRYSFPDLAKMGLRNEIVSLRPLHNSKQIV